MGGIIFFTVDLNAEGLDWEGNQPLKQPLICNTSYCRIGNIFLGEWAAHKLRLVNPSSTAADTFYSKMVSGLSKKSQNGRFDCAQRPF